MTMYRALHPIEKTTSKEIKTEERVLLNCVFIY